MLKAENSYFVKTVIFFLCLFNDLNAQNTDSVPPQMPAKLDCVIVQPDTVFFLKPDDFEENNQFSITNISTHTVNVDTLVVTENWSYELFDLKGEILSYPIAIPPGDSTTVAIVPALLTGGGFSGRLLADTLSVIMDVGQDTVIIVINSDLVGAVSDPIDENAVTSFALWQNYPNPFNPSTTIQFALPKAVHVKIEVFNLLGQRVTTLLDKSLTAGSHKVEFEAQQLASEVYVVRMAAGAFRSARKMLYLK